MSEEAKIGKIEDLSERLAGVQEQLSLALQMLMRHEIRFGIMRVPEARLQAMPGQESVVQDIPVPDDAPLVRLQAVKMPSRSKIVSANGHMLKAVK